MTKQPVASLVQLARDAQPGFNPEKAKHVQAWMWLVREQEVNRTTEPATPEDRKAWLTLYAGWLYLESKECWSSPEQRDRWYLRFVAVLRQHLDRLPQLQALLELLEKAELEGLEKTP